MVTNKNIYGIMYNSGNIKDKSDFINTKLQEESLEMVWNQN